MCLLSSLLYLSLVVVGGLGFFFVTFDRNARILIFSSFCKCIVCSALSQLISHPFTWNVLYSNTDCCLCIYQGILQWIMFQLAFSLQSTKSILVVSEINICVWLFCFGLIFFFFFYLWKWSSIKHCLFHLFQTICIFRWMALFTAEWK